MKPHEQRVVDEQLALDEKREKLDAFINGPVFPTLDGTDRALLKLQYREMTDYSETLGMRIRRFTPHQENDE